MKEITVILHAGPEGCGAVGMMARGGYKPPIDYGRSSQHWLPNGEHPQPMTLVKCGACGKPMQMTRTILQRLKLPEDLL